jgi:hypothetical protein
MAQSPKPGDYFPPENFPLSHPFFTHFRPLLNAAGFSSKASNIDALRQRRTQHLLRLQSCSFNSTLEREMTRFRTVIEAPFRKTQTEKESFNATHAETADSVPSAVFLRPSDKQIPLRTITSARRFSRENSTPKIGNKQSTLRNPALNKPAGKSVPIVSHASPTPMGTASR